MLHFFVAEIIKIKSTTPCPNFYNYAGIQIFESNIFIVILE